MLCAGQPCDYHICNNGGSCSTLNGVPMCTCTSEWIGDYCELNASVALQGVTSAGLSADDGMSYVSCMLLFYDSL